MNIKSKMLRYEESYTTHVHVQYVHVHVHAHTYRLTVGEAT